MKSAYTLIFLMIIAFGCSSPKSQESVETADSTTVNTDTLTTKEIVEQTAKETSDHPTEEEKGFLDFIQRFKEGRDISTYAEENYSGEFMTPNYGGPVAMQHLWSSDQAQIFAVQWGEMEVEFNQIWVYSNEGERKSQCPLPVQDAKMEIHEFRIDTLKPDEVALHIQALYSEYKVGTSEEGFPERGEFIQKRFLSMILGITDDLQCYFAERSADPVGEDITSIPEEVIEEEIIPELPPAVPCPGMELLTDKEGFEYPTVVFDTICWTAKNLESVTYRNGDSIKHAPTAEEWKKCAEEQVGCWCYYNNDEENGKKFGKLYNFWAVVDERNIAPEGWMVPKNAMIFQNILKSEAGIAMKSTDGWAANGNGDNRTGFNGLPGGIRWDNGTFRQIDSVGYWWGTIFKSWLRAEESEHGRSQNELFVRYAKRSEGQGLSVRLVREE